MPQPVVYLWSEARCCCWSRAAVPSTGSAAGLLSGVRPAQVCVLQGLLNWLFQVCLHGPAPFAALGPTPALTVLLW